MNELKSAIRDIPGFPKEGVIFKDITTLLKDKEKFRQTIDLFAEKLKGKKIDAVVSIEARGFIFGAALAYKLGAGIIPVRKKGKLPYKTYSVTYQLEYGNDTLEIHQDAFKKGDSVLIIDDLLATGGTCKAVIGLVEKMGGKIAGIAFLIELTALKGREKFKGYDIITLIQDEYC
ncbi:MAG: adenine phosphoribosyltransferase [Candidatus Omnitrophica bacterium]|nr:adenine phosphoribosyltransferase [Candidatus Omnitrophota bacterium]